MRIGAAALALPLAMFTLFAIGEAAVLEPGWWGHLLQVAVVGLLAALAWIYPRIGGPLLIVAGAIFGAMVLRGTDELSSGLLTVALFPAPLVVAGVCFSLAGFSTPGPSRSGP